MRLVELVAEAELSLGFARGSGLGALLLAFVACVFILGAPRKAIGKAMKRLSKFSIKS